MLKTAQSADGLGFRRGQRLIPDQSDLETPLIGGVGAGDGMRQIRSIPTPKCASRARIETASGGIALG
jgi:hypothetical protein